MNLEIEMQKSVRSIFFYIVSSITICLTISFFLYGDNPFGSISNLPSYYHSISAIDCISSGKAVFFNCPIIGVPRGSLFVQGAPFYYLGAFIIQFTGNAVYAIQYTNLIFLIAAFYGFVALCIRLGARFFIANYFAIIYLISPFLIGHVAGFSVTGLGFAILPLAILMDLILINLIRSFSTTSHIQIYLYMLAYAVFRLFYIFLDGYAFLFSLLVSFFLGLSYYIARKKRNSTINKLATLTSISTWPVFAPFIIMMSNILAVLIYKILVLRGGSYEAMPPDFYRGSGVDLITLIWPSDKYFFANKLGFSFKFNSLDFFGDGSNVIFNYLGVLLILGLIIFIKRFKAINYDWKLYGLLIVLVTSFVLSLGPSLKINDHTNINKDKGIVVKFHDYLMPKGVATLDFGTDVFFSKIPGINNIRAVHRWNHVVRLILLIFTCLLVSLLVNKNKKMAYMLMVIIMLDNLPSAINNLQLNKNLYNQFQQFNNDIIEPLRKDLIPGEKVFYISTANDYLADYLTDKTNTKSFNVGGDKSIVLAQEEWPRQIVEFRKNKNIKINLIDLLEQNIADVLVLPFFSLRWDSYSWPPSSEKIMLTSAQYREKYSFLLNDSYRFKCSNYYCVIRKI